MTWSNYARNVLSRAGRFIIFAAFLLSSPAFSSAFIAEIDRPGSYFSESESPQIWLMQSAHDWMKYIDGTTRLNRISIPGTHDSGALHGGRVIQTQTWTIHEQLNAGIRFFDIRCRPADGAFEIHHGPVSQKQMFDDVMNTMVAFLEANPSEAIVMRVKTSQKKRKKKRPSVEQIWQRYMARYGQYFHIGSSIPALDHMRGKILVMREGFTAAEGMSWGDFTSLQDRFVVFKSDKEKITKNRVSLASKKQLVKSYIDKAEDPGDRYVINFLSGAVLMSPPAVARETNGAAYEHIGYKRGKRNLGILVIDFPGDRLLQRIINTNFQLDE